MAGLLTEVLAAHEEERREIRTVLQQDIGQILTAMTLHLRMVENICEGQECREQIAEVRTLAGDALRSIERLSRELYPPALQSQGLGAAVEVYAKDFAHLSHIRTELDFEVLTARPALHVELALFRMVQAALDNIQRYGFASAVQIILRQLEDTLYLVIEDDGRSYTPELLSRWDFRRITHRAEALGGVVHVESLPGMSARLIIKLPMKGEHSGKAEEV
ncbi:MAG: hypothetical protein JXN59_07925 [Anaerolineae bacterium]|nr:hypothetical protein [Anaerolineae bacterium]